MAMKKKTMTLNLTEQEMEIVEKLSTDKGLSKTGLIRQALRLYQHIDARLEDGATLTVEHPFNKKAEIIIP